MGLVLTIVLYEGDKAEFHPELQSRDLDHGPSLVVDMRPAQLRIDASIGSEFNMYACQFPWTISC